MRETHIEPAHEWHARMMRMQRRLIVLCIAWSFAGALALIEWVAA